jgi:hypothetical protein
METNSIIQILSETKWLLTKDTENNGYARDVLVRCIPGIMRQELPSVLSYLKTHTSAKNANTSTTVVDPTTTPEGAWSGTYTGGLIWYEFCKSNEPGATKEGTYTLYQALHKGGATEVGITIEHGCRYHTTQTWYYDYATLATVPEATSGVQYSRTTPIRNEEFGTWTYAIETKTRLYQTVAEYTAERDQFEYRQKTEHRGVYAGDLTDVGGAITALPNLATQVAGVIAEINRSKNDDCTQDIDVVKRNAVNITNADTSKQIALTETTQVALDKNDAAAETLPTSQTAGTIVSVKVHKNDFALFDNEIQTRTATAISDQALSGTITAFEEVDEDTDKNQISAGTIPVAQAAGAITTVESVRNDFDRYDVTTKTRVATAVSDAGTSKTISMLETVDEDTDRNQPTAGTHPGTQTAGEIKTVESTKNDFGRYDVSTKVRTAINVDDVQVSKTVSKFDTIDEDLDRNETAAGTPPSFSAGTIVTVESVKNDFAKYDVKTNTRTAVAVTNAEQSKSMAADETQTRDVNRNQTAGATLPTTFTAGTIAEVINRLNDYGRYDTDSRASVAVYIHQEYNWTDRYGTAYVYWGRNATTAEYASILSTAALDATTNNSISKTTNRFGLIDYLITKQPYGAGGGTTGETTSTGADKKITTIQNAQIWDSTLKRSVLSKRTITTAWSLTWEASYGAAQSGIKDGNEGSKVIQSKGLYGAYKTTVTKSTWSADET